MIEKANLHIELVTGMIKRLFTTDGVQIMHIDEIKNGCGYVAVANSDPFMKIRYDRLDLSKRPSTSYKGLQGYTLNNEYLAKIRPVTKKGREEEPKPVWGRQISNRRIHTAKSRKSTAKSTAKSTPKLISKKQAVIGDGMETEARPTKTQSTQFSESTSKVMQSIIKPEEERIEKPITPKPITPVTVTKESVEKSIPSVPNQVDSSTEGQIISKSPKTIRAKSAINPKITAAQFEDPVIPVPKLIREQSLGMIKSSRY